jgi:glyoxylase-like metal-dependent hydrolase (beta-lactamase superfamily II)
MSRRTLASVITLLFLIGVVAAQSRRPAGTAHNGNAFRFNQVTEGVYHAIGTGSLAVVGNSSVIVNDNDVIIVDDHVSPAAAWVLLEEVKTLTKKPPAAKAKLQTQLQVTENNYASQKELKPTPPNVTLNTNLTLFRGSREIQIRYLGRGHTAGDVVVFLPKERMVMTGDFLTSGLSNMSDSYPQEWVTSLDALKKLDFQTVLPGHGEAFTDRAKIDYFQAYLRDVWTETSRLKKEGVSAEEAAKRVDMTKHKGNLPIQAPGIPPIAATRIYDLLDGKAK